MTADDLSLDESNARARLRRINEATTARAAAYAEAGRVGRDGWARYSPEERIEREQASDAAFTDLADTFESEVRDQVARLEQQLVDLDQPLVGISTENLQRVAALRAEIRLQLSRSAPAEIGAAAGAAVRAGDRVLASTWAQEIAEYINETSLSKDAVSQLVAVVRSLRDQADDPETMRRRRALERRRDALRSHQRELREALTPVQLELAKRVLAANGKYGAL